MRRQFPACRHCSAARPARKGASVDALTTPPARLKNLNPSLIRLATSLALAVMPQGTLRVRHALRIVSAAVSTSGMTPPTAPTERRGPAGQAIVGGTPYRVKTGDMLLIPRNTWHNAFPDPDGLMYELVNLIEPELQTYSSFVCRSRLGKCVALNRWPKRRLTMVASCVKPANRRVTDRDTETDDARRPRVSFTSSDPKTANNLRGARYQCC